MSQGSHSTINMSSKIDDAYMLSQLSPSQQGQGGVDWMCLSFEVLIRFHAELEWRTNIYL